VWQVVTETATAAGVGHVKPRWPAPETCTTR
jgi:hypothetical protein